MLRLLILALASTVATSTVFGAEDNHVWWEGEATSSASSDLSTNHPYDARHEALSEGVSLGSGQSGPNTWAEYEVEVPQEGEWSFYVRMFWHHGPFRFQWNGGDWNQLENDTLLDGVPLHSHVINWQAAGRHQLPAGTNTLRIEAIENYGPFVLDCFTLVNVPFEPNGTLRPGQKLGLAEEGRWAFEPDIDAFDRDDALGLAELNEAMAGATGYVAMSEDGDFVRGDGEPIRFWCVNSGVHGRSNLEDVRAHARHLTKRGVNMLRYHCHFNPGADEDIMQVNEEQIAGVHRGVALYKQHGIYATISPYWAFSQAGPAWGLKGHDGGQPWSMLFWDEDLQAAYKHWITETFTRPNPFDPDGTPLAKDPAVAIFQIQNEDSMLFWTTMQVQGEKLARLTAIYHQWRADNGLAGTPPLNLKFWEADNADQGLRDTLRFFTESMHAWNVEAERFMREEIGYTGLINAGNWRTANQARMLDLERYSYDANQVIAVNRYVNGGRHINPSDNHKSGYLVAKGDFFQDESVLLRPSALPTNARQVANKAFLITESTWTPPMSYQSEGPFLISAYSSLNAIDGYYWFALGSVGYDQSINKWQSANPAIMGGWPAASLMFRKGYIERGEPAIHEERTLEDLFSLAIPKLVEGAGFDANRDQDIDVESGPTGEVDPAAYLVGPVEVVYGGDPAQTRVIDLEKYVDHDQQVITSNTDQLVWDYGTGVCTLDAPKAQGATGFLAAKGRIDLGAVSIDSGNDYATILAVSLDDRELAKSERILLQITTRCRPYGWETSEQTITHEDKQHAGQRIESVGGAPWNVWNTDCTITVRNPGLRTATLLDANLYPTEEQVDTKRAGGALAVTPPANAMYLVLSR